MKQRVRRKKVQDAPDSPDAPEKKRAPRKNKDPLHGPFKASADQIAEAARRKSKPGEPFPDDFFPTDEEDKERVIEQYRGKIRNPMTAIRAFCVGCMGGYLAEVNRCETKTCALHAFRMGNNPYHTRKKNGESDDG